MKKGRNNAPRRLRGVAVALGILLILVLVCAAYVLDFYKAVPSDIGSETEIQVSEAKNQMIFMPDAPKAGLIFYPGGKVAYESYEPLMRLLADRGIACILLQMPCNLAVLSPNAADGIIAQYPEISHWVLAGHSLGGVMAAGYAGSHEEDFEGLVLLAAYSSADLSDSRLKVLSIYGTEDGVMNRDSYQEGQSKLPADSSELVIDGGCHAFFGSYGSQKGDGTPTISREAQLMLTADAIRDFIEDIVSA